MFFYVVFLCELYSVSTGKATYTITVCVIVSESGILYTCYKFDLQQT